MKHLSDEEVIKLILEKKDTSQFSLLYDRYADKVYAKCLSFSKDLQQAEDMAHDIFLKTYLKLGEFEFRSKFSTWLYSITYHFCIDQKRKGEKMTESYQFYYEQQDLAEDDTSLMEIQVNMLKQLLEQISPEDKALLLMKYQDDLPISEITLITNLSESAVKMRLKRARDKIVLMSKTYKI